MLKFGVAISLLFFLTGCTIIGGLNPLTGSVAGFGETFPHTIDAENFTAISVSGHYDISFAQADEFSVVLYIQENLFPHVEVSVEDGVFSLTNSRNFHTQGIAPVLFIYAPDLDCLTLAGASGAIVDVDTERLNISIAGASRLLLAGRADVLDISIAGAGDVDASWMTANHVSVSIAGAGEVEVYAAETLDVSIAGAGTVIYDGNATVTRSIAGVGSVRPRG